MTDENKTEARLDRLADAAQSRATALHNIDSRLDGIDDAIQAHINNAAKTGGQIAEHLGTLAQVASVQPEAASKQWTALSKLAEAAATLKREAEQQTHAAVRTAEATERLANAMEASVALQAKNAGKAISSEEAVHLIQKFIAPLRPRAV